MALPRAIHLWARPLRVPPTGLVLLSMCSAQVGAALAKQLFGALGPVGAVSLRVGFGALVLALFSRPRLRGHSRAGYRAALLFGVTLAVMNVTFYMAISRVPLGAAVTVEFVGPLAVAVIGSRRPLDLLWVALAAAGTLTLAPIGIGGGKPLDPLGILLALGAGVLWAIYIYLSARVGREFTGGVGLSLAMLVASMVLVPAGIATAGRALLSPGALAIGLGVGVLSSVVPYSLELEALRSLPPRVFGVLMSLEPAVAALAGLLVLHEGLTARTLIAIVLVTVASLGATRSRPVAVAAPTGVPADNCLPER
jgi:inner membrane transporter RhtA